MTRLLPGLCCALALATSGQARAGEEAGPAPGEPAPPSVPAAIADDLDREAAARSLEEDLRRMRADRPLDTEESFTLRSVLWMFASMAVVIGAIYITLNHGLRKLLGVRAVGSASLVQVMERVPLDQKKSLYVLRAAGEYLLVGGADAGLTLLCKLDTQQVERLEQESRVQGPGLSPFLQKLLSRKGGATPPPA